MRRRAAAGFTFIELIVVLAIIAIASATVSLAIRDPSATRLEHEAARLVALLEGARAEARASGLAARWKPTGAANESPGFTFIGLPGDHPTTWLEEGVAAQVEGTGVLTLGPEPLIGAQRVVLSLGEKRLVIATDGLGPFAVADEGAAALR